MTGNETELLYLFWSVLILGAVPVIYRLCRGRSQALTALDGFVFVSMGGIILLDFLPQALEAGGWPCVVFAVLGVGLPTVIERRAHRLGEHFHRAALYLGLLGLLIHSMLDGVYLGSSGADSGLLPLAVILHRLPVGLTVWWLVRWSRGRAAAMLLLGVLAVLTALGYFAGAGLLDGLSGKGLAWFQSLVAGSLFHVVLHRSRGAAPEEAPAAAGRKVPLSASGVGGFLGLALVVFLLTGEHGGHAHSGEHDEFWPSFLALALQSAPALLLGYSLAGLVAVFLPVSSVRWLGGGSLTGQALRGVAVGLPLPVCSCGVVPLYRALVERGVPATAALAFLVATPELGTDAILLSLPLLGGPFTLIRIAAAAVLALAVAVIVGRTISSRTPENSAAAAEDTEGAAGGLLDKLGGGIKTGLGTLVDHTGPWVLVGLAVAALVGPLVRDSWLVDCDPYLQVALFAVLGIPVYVCASGATPMVAVLLAGGVSPGAALAFLLTGPATNVVTFGVISDLHGRKTAVFFCVMMATLAVTIGFAVNQFFPGFAALDPQAGHDHSADYLAWTCLWILGGLFLFSLLRRGPREVVGSVFSVEALSGAEGGDEDEGHDCCAGGGEAAAETEDEPGGCCGN
ncbi:MAG: permease [Planctomycetota bacterium]|nr:permease [Planctomycetota bacterium]